MPLGLSLMSASLQLHFLLLVDTDLLVHVLVMASI